MKQKPAIAVAGATGVVGNEIVALFGQHKIPYSEIRLFASAQSAGEIYDVAHESVAVEALEESVFEDIDYVIFATAPDVAGKLVPSAVSAGATVIDCSGFYAAEDSVPVVIPAINGAALAPGTKVIAAPTPAVVQLAPVLKAVHEAAGLQRVVLSSFQSVSGAGKLALDELWEQTLAIFNQREIVQEQFPHQIAFNLIPQVGSLQGDGRTREEERIVSETRKVLGLPALPMSVTAVRVPVLYCYGESVNIEMERELQPQDLTELLQGMSDIELYPDFENYPMPLTAAATDRIHVGRIRRDPSVANGLDLWIVADNVRCGVALNALRILKSLVEK